MGPATGPGRVDYLADSPCFHGSADLAMVSCGLSASANNLPDEAALLKAMIAALSAENAKMSATLRAHDVEGRGQCVGGRVAGVDDRGREQVLDRAS